MADLDDPKHFRQIPNVIVGEYRIRGRWAIVISLLPGP